MVSPRRGAGTSPLPPDRQRPVNERYRLISSSAGAGEFHLRSLPDPARPELWWHDATAPALVLGSSQPMSDIDADACVRAGIEVVRRRSGGGAVLLVPGEVVWLDVIVPSGSPDWSPDVHAQMVWLGQHLAAVIETLLVDAPDTGGEVAVHTEAMITTPWSRRICFDGVGVGEVLLDGRKLVGISQRRTRVGARLQCCWYTDYDPNALLELLAAPVRPSSSQLRPVATVTPAVAGAIPAALQQRLGTVGGDWGDFGREMGNDG